MIPYSLDDPMACRSAAAMANLDKQRQLVAALYAINNGDMASLQAMADGGWALAELVDGDSGRMLLHRSAQVDNEPAVKLLLKLGSPIDPYTSFQETPLHLAVRNNKLACVKALVEAGASTSALYSSNGDTALTLAKKYKYEDIVLYLKSKDAAEFQTRVPLSLRLDSAFLNR